VGSGDMSAVRTTNCGYTNKLIGAIIKG